MKEIRNPLKGGGLSMADKTRWTRMPIPLLGGGGGYDARAQAKYELNKKVNNGYVGKSMWKMKRPNNIRGFGGRKKRRRRRG